MTREEIIDGLNDIAPKRPKSEWGRCQREIVDEAIEALQTEPCEDAISRSELLKAIYTWDKFGCDADTKLVPYQDHYIPYIHYDDVVKCIKGMPSVTPEKVANWVGIDEYPHEDWECNNCGRIVATETPYKEYKYCPSCGRRMMEAQKNEADS